NGTSSKVGAGCDFGTRFARPVGDFGRRGFGCSRSPCLHGSVTAAPTVASATHNVQPHAPHSASPRPYLNRNPASLWPSCDAGERGGLETAIRTRAGRPLVVHVVRHTLEETVGRSPVGLIPAAVVSQMDDAPGGVLPPRGVEIHQLPDDFLAGLAIQADGKKP